MDTRSSQLKELEKQEQTKPRPSRKKEITKIKEELNEIETYKKIPKYKIKSCFFEKKIVIPLVSLTKKRRGKV